MTQGDPLSPTIFNVVVDEVVRHCVSVMVDIVEDRGESGQEGSHQNALFYAEDGMVASLDSQCLQVFFSTMVRLFYRVVLHTNVGKTVLICSACFRQRGLIQRWRMVYG